MNKLRDNLRSSPWREVLLATFSAILGIVAGPIFGNITEPWFSSQNLPIAVFTIVSILFLVGTTYSLTMWRATHKEMSATHTAVGNELSAVRDYIHAEINAVSDNVMRLADASGRKVQILPLEKRYKELHKRVQRANSEILMLSNYIFDWDNQRQGYPRDRVQSVERKAYYEALHMKLMNARRHSFRFRKIIQVLDGHKLEELFPHDPLLEADCRFLAEIGKTEPEFASLRTARIMFQIGFTVFDRSSVVLYLEIRDPETGHIDSPSVIFIDDPSSEAIQIFLKLYDRIEAKSRLITHIP
jgi:hypothetical protein